ncbi:MAG TPA: hypothetical protein VLZ28_02615 [Daejeonella sp.]|nr:hypothetical protein [Daejeonella sp.]
MMTISKTFLLIALGSFMLLSCKKDKPATPLHILGTWIETKDRADTLVFMDESMLNLRRGKELYNGLLLPRAWSGFYTYQIKPDSIGLHWMLSSNSNAKRYKFTMQSNQIHIGDFYQKDPSQSSVLIFERLK